jgi:quercetin dioxygenase-like cupin family protein
MAARKLSEEWIHLGLGATAVPQPPFDGFQWYEDYGNRVKADGNDARIVAQFRFTESWETWEMHPNGHEVVICISGQMTLIQEEDGKEVRTTLSPGEYAINDPGVWHTADIDEPAEGIFITAGVGTQMRPREATS